MGEHIESFGIQYSETELFDVCFDACEKLQAFYMSGSTSKYPYGEELSEFVQKCIDGEPLNEEKT